MLELSPAARACWSARGLELLIHHAMSFHVILPKASLMRRVKSLSSLKKGYGRTVPASYPNVLMAKGCESFLSVDSFARLLLFQCSFEELRYVAAAGVWFRLLCCFAVFL